MIDVRTPAEFASGHLEGAINIDVQSPDFDQQVAQLDPSATYLVYCRGGLLTLQVGSLLWVQWLGDALWVGTVPRVAVCGTHRCVPQSF